ncbi:MAG: HAD-IA family hydrolase, partial [Anaerolineae bacterium]|nr:HAD-IA family hydrolase [Anaerolineae bacterium]
AGVQAAMATAWHPPDPVALAQPLADLTGLFGTLKSQALKIAIATSDDHTPTEALILAWGLSPLVDAIIGADDGLAHKPDPQMLLHLCDRFNLSPAKAVMVGDNPDDLRMGRAAAVGLTVGVLSGLGSADNLGPLADVILADVGRLISP